MRTPILALFAIMIMAGCNNKKEQSEIPAQTVKYELEKDSSVYSGEMKRYWLVLLKKGTNRTQDSASTAKIQAAHIANINRLAREGKIIMAGPMGTDGDLRGIFIMNAKDSTEVSALVNTDTAVITGRLKMEYYPWWSEKGKYIFK
ncbi:MAG TPA: YciI family protein [Chitinophagaceae bacterium]|nr:YciI family protein [Chitinophagaceae bacterium]